jgi:hypothetical protein
MRFSFLRSATYWLRVISLGLVVGISIQFVQAWTAPTSAPPAGNVSGPLTTGDAAQIKTGNLALNTSGLYANALLIPNGSVGVGTLSPTAKLDVAGTIQGTGFKLPVGAGVGKVLTSDAAGVASWQTASSGGNVASYNNLPSGALAGYCQIWNDNSSNPFSSLPNYEPGYNDKDAWPPKGCQCRAGFTLLLIWSELTDQNLPESSRYICVKN